MNINQKGFGIVEVLIVVVILGLIGGTGWYVTQAKNKANQTLDSASSAQTNPQKTEKKEEATKDETADWTIYETPQNEYSFKVADGWKLYKKQDSNESFFSRTSLALQLGTKGEVLPFQSFGHGEAGCGLYWDWAKLSKQDYDEAVARSDEYTDKIFTSSGVEVKKSAGPGQGLYDASTKVYSYFLAKNLQTINIGYAVCAGETDHNDVVEKVIKTIVIN